MAPDEVGVLVIQVIRFRVRRVDVAEVRLQMPFGENRVEASDPAIISGRAGPVRGKARILRGVRRSLPAILA